LIGNRSKALKNGTGFNVWTMPHLQVLIGYNRYLQLVITKNIYNFSRDGSSALFDPEANNRTVERWVQSCTEPHFNLKGHFRSKNPKARIFSANFSEPPDASGNFRDPKLSSSYVETFKFFRDGSKCLQPDPGIHHPTLAMKLGQLVL
jgi:hypothetical protein